jgi:signal transduction histidine kinase
LVELINTLQHQPTGHLLVERNKHESNIVFSYRAANKKWREQWAGNSNLEGKDISKLFPHIFDQELLNTLNSAFESDQSLFLKVVLEQQDHPNTYFSTIRKLNSALLLFSLTAEDDYISLSQTATEAPKSVQHLKNKNVSLETEVANQKQRYQSASQELNDFTYSVSHDLRAPLRRLDGFSEALLQDKYVEYLDEKGVHYLQRIRQAAQDMGQLIDDLLKLSRISRRNIERQEVNVTQLANNILNTLQEERPELDIIHKIEEQITVEADPGLTKVVLQNLLSNAVKFSSKKDSCHIEVGTQKDNSNIIYVQDNGVGFDKKFAQKLFGAFQRLHSEHEFEGTGIGLATVKRIVTMHGGDIWAESPEGGATFYFTLSK